VEVQQKSETVILKKLPGCDTVYAVYILVEMTKAQIIHVNCLGFGRTRQFTDRNLKQQLIDRDL
jgi:hypothetical protein